MIASIHQPEHLPWMGLIHKISVSDIYVVLDTVQFKKNYFENRNRIYTPQGLQWITVPVQMVGHMDKPFHEIQVQPNWKKKYLKSLIQNYSKAPFIDEIIPVVECIESWDGIFLAELNLSIICRICDILEVKTKILKSSEIACAGKKTSLLISILQKIEANSYLVGKSGFDYIEVDQFEAAGINLIKHNFTHPKYKPFNNQEMTDYPSVFDVIANLGVRRVREALNL
jgi:hypothetical protein